MPVFEKTSRHGRSPIKRLSSGMSVCLMSAEQLRSCLETDENSSCPRAKTLLMLDCRSFVAYNEGHITGSLNVHCPALLRRRSRGTIPLRTLVPSSHFCSMLTSNRCSPVVLCEEIGKTFSKFQGNSYSPTEQLTTAEFVAKCLHVETGLKSICYLESGFENFQQNFPHLCSTAEAALNTNAPFASILTCPVLDQSLPASCKSSATILPLSSKTLWEQKVEYGGPVEILPHLWLGSAGDASKPHLLKQLGITALLNVSRTNACQPESLSSIRYKNIPLKDSSCQVIDCFFKEAFDFIDEAKRSQGKVLVHCRAGVSRSATICIAYLMSNKLLRMEEAYEHVKARRCIVSPNFNFMGQLLDFEQQLFCRHGNTRLPRDANEEAASSSACAQAAPKD